MIIEETLQNISIIDISSNVQLNTTEENIIITDEINNISVNDISSNVQLNTTEENIIITDATQGPSGLSAYQIWLNNGNTGTEEDFINSLKADIIWGDVTGDINNQTDIIDGSLDILGLNTSYTITDSEATGQTFWDSVNSTLATKLNDNVTLQHGQETHIYIKNQTGATLSDGKAIMFAGAVGASGRLKGQYAIADGSLPASYTMGIATENITNDGDGFVTSFGKINKIDTTGTPYGETWNEGDLLYISPITAGALTNVKPQAPDLEILVAAVINVHAINGTIFVRPTFPHKLVDLADVNGMPLTTTGQIPVWNQTLGYFDFDYNITNYLLSSTANSSYQPILVSGTNIKTVNGTSLLGSGNLVISNAVDSVNGKTGVVVLDADDIADGITNKAYTTTEQTKLAGIATNATANLSDATLLDRANHTGNQAISTIIDLQTALDAKVDENIAITGATKTKITYDTKGLVISGADATTADIADSLNKRYVTDAQLTIIGNTSGTNTGDQTSIVGIAGTKSEFDTAITDGNFLYVGDITQYTDELAQDAIGSILINSSEINFTYDDVTPTISASIITGSIDETKLDTSVNASLDLADSSLQNGDNISELTNDSGYITGIVWGDITGLLSTQTDLQNALNNKQNILYETVSKNLNSYDYSITYTGSDIDYITYDLGGGLSIIKTFNYTGSDLTSIVLSGDTPSGIDLTKTLSYTAGNLTGVSYA